MKQGTINTPYYNEFRWFLIELSKNEIIGTLYYNLFSLFDIKELEDDLKELHDIKLGKYKHIYGELHDDSWFTIWHKKVRQTDYFNNFIGYKVVNKLTPEETEKYAEVKKKMNALKEKTIYSKDRKKKKNEELTKAYDELYAMDEYKTLLKEMKGYNEIEQTKENIQLGGFLDMMLWNLIHLDSKNRLLRIFKNVFEEIETMKTST